MHPPCTIVVTVGTVAVAWQGRIRSHLFGVRLSSSVGRVQGIMRNLPACMLIRSARRWYHVHNSRLDYPRNDYCPLPNAVGDDHQYLPDKRCIYQKFMWLSPSDIAGILSV